MLKKRIVCLELNEEQHCRLPVSNEPEAYI